MSKSPALLTILLLIAARGITMLSGLMLNVYQNFLYTIVDARFAYRLLATLPTYLIAIVSAFALGLSANGLRLQRFQDKTVGAALTALATIAFIQAFNSALRVGGL